MNLFDDVMFEKIKNNIEQTLEDMMGSHTIWSEEALLQIEPQLHQQFIEKRIYQYALPAEADGFNLGQRIITLICEEIGKSLIPLSFIDFGCAATILALLPEKSENIELMGKFGTGEVKVCILEDSVGEVKRKNDVLIIPKFNRERFASGTVSHYILPVRDKNKMAFFVIPADSPGLNVIPVSDYMMVSYFKVQSESLVLEPKNIIGELSLEEPKWEQIIARHRLYQASYLLGLIKGAYQTGVNYSKARRQFGQNLIEFQSIAFNLAALVPQIQALTLKIAYASWLEDTGSSSLLASTEALALALELADLTGKTSIHIHGAFGMDLSSKIQYYYRLIAFFQYHWPRSNSLWLECAQLRLSSG